ncbi:hypothetical protein J5Y04_04895 [Kitasatospora sp. RG8]|uniref:hypothetical protein n=1 Tax=Kitasatospora sp. RG8 TaxID=2820815 RepID=UPI001ADF69D5|nr:hypothetical protein [Kitasatospora sp. RG8]MBP0448880.1 hypothetical protein [Kitasatospora sp. RG8]
MADTRLVLGRRTDLVAGADRELLDHADGRPLPGGIGAALDLTSAGLFGHSMGGATIVRTLPDDPRVRAGATLDGPVFGTATDGVDRPCCSWAPTTCTRSATPCGTPSGPGSARGADRLRSPAPAISPSATAFPLPQAQRVAARPADRLEHFLGTGTGTGTDTDGRAVAAQRAYLTAFFDLRRPPPPDRTLRRPVGPLPRGAPPPLSRARPRYGRSWTARDIV